MTLNVDGRDVGTQTAQVVGDPAIEIADADRREQFEASMALHALHERADEAMRAVTAAYDQMAALREGLTLDEAEEVPAAVTSRLDELDEALDPVRRRFGVDVVRRFRQQNVRSQVTRLKREVMSSTSRPTETQVRRIGESRTALGEAIDEANTVIGDVRSFYSELVEQGLYPADLKQISPITSGTRE